MEIHRINSGNVNCYIVADQGGAILIDTGRQQYREKILKQCRRFSVRLIVLTHGHLDHCQNAAYLADALSVPIAMHERDRNLIPDNTKQPLSSNTFLGRIVLSASLRSFEKDTLDVFEPTVLLRAGDSLKPYGVDAEVVELPGHTNGSIGLKLSDVLFVGDALMNMFYPTTAMLYTDESLMRQSAVQISGMGNMKIYFGHGGPVRNRNWV